MSNKDMEWKVEHVITNILDCIRIIHFKVCEAYKKIAASRSKKKSPSKKEKEVFIKTFLPKIIEILANSLC